METLRYHVRAEWDAESRVWVATSEDVPGLATEADTIEELTDKLRRIVPELLAANHLPTGDVEDGLISFELVSHRQELVTLAS